MNIINIANIVTISRIILTVVFVFFILEAHNTALSFKTRLIYQYLTLICFFLAAISDYIDGKLARTYGLVTDFGKLIDPLADKILILTAFVSFLTLNENVLSPPVPLWAVVVIIGREFAITGLRLLAMADSKILIPSKWNKHKTFSQMFCIFTILTYLVLKDTCKFLECRNILLNKIIFYLPDYIYVFICWTVFLTLASGVFYLMAHRSVIFAPPKK